MYQCFISDSSTISNRYISNVRFSNFQHPTTTYYCYNADRICVSILKSIFVYFKPPFFDDLNHCIMQAVRAEVVYGTFEVVVFQKSIADGQADGQILLACT